jgi:peptidoglycan glycosyltransferase
MRTDRTFEKLLAVGLTTILGIQAFIIIGGVIRVVPLTGITLPFVSYGGSSLVANYVILALLMRVSDSSARRLGEIPDKATLGDKVATRRALRRAARQYKGARAENGPMAMNSEFPTS